MIEHKISLININTLKPHERVSEHRLEEVQRSILTEGVLHRAIVADMYTYTVIDGHHRLEFFRRIGLTLVPVALIDYHDPRVIAARWDGRGLVEKKLVIERAARGELFPPKTTRHIFASENGIVHISEAIPEVSISLRHLFEYAVFYAERAALRGDTFSPPQPNLLRQPGLTGWRREPLPTRALEKRGNRRTGRV